MTEVFAPAKLNLCLHITGKRESDGYHLLDSLMVFTAFGDTLTVQQADATSLTVQGDQAHILHGDLLSVDRDSPNLIIKAYYAMCDALKKNESININLSKHIPSGAGLGGGSSDAATMMTALNDLWGSPLTLQELSQISLPLGAEMPVCLAQKAARVQGIGETITPLPTLPSFPILIVWPDVPLLTADVFKAYRDSKPRYDNPLPALPQSDDINTWIDYLANTGNSLTDTAITLCPAVKDILNTLEVQNGCRLARMSGSGSACFAIFNTIEEAHQAARHFEGYQAVVTRSL